MAERKERSLFLPLLFVGAVLLGLLVAATASDEVNMLTAVPYHSEHDGCLARYVRTGQARIAIGREATGRTSLLRQAV